MKNQNSTKSRQTTRGRMCEKSAKRQSEKMHGDPTIATPATSSRRSEYVYDATLETLLHLACLAQRGLDTNPLLIGYVNRNLNLLCRMPEFKNAVRDALPTAR